MIKIRVGVDLPLYPQTISTTDGEKGPSKALVGMVAYIPKHRRYFVAEFKTGGVPIRECFKLPLLPCDTPLVKEKRNEKR